MKSQAGFKEADRAGHGRRMVAGWVVAACMVAGCSPAESQPQASPLRHSGGLVKLVFIHHSCGENWLADDNGGLGRALAANNFFVSDTNYGWGPDQIGDRTDITDWPEWFVGSRSGEYLQAVYRESGQNCQYARTAADPGGENEIVMFKSCFPNSNLEGSPQDQPARGEGLTVANAKAIYRELLEYFATRPDKLFIAITAPPVQDRTWAANARAFNTWLVQEWLAGYRGNNVAVFDFYNVLTAPKNHHRCRDGKIEYLNDQGGDSLYYPSDGDDHPSAPGNRKATQEFVSLLNFYYDRWSAAKPGIAPPGEPRDESLPPPGKNAASPPPGNVPSPAKPAATTVGGERIDDFESEPTSWTAFLDTAKDTRLTFRRDTSRQRGGKASLQIQYDLAPDSWALCSLVNDRPQDWSRYRGLSLYLQAEKPGHPVTIVAYGGTSPDALLNFEHPLKEVAVDGWQRIDIPWTKFKPPEWQGDSTAKYDPRSAMGVAIAVHSSESSRFTGALWIDDLSLISDK